MSRLGDWPEERVIAQAIVEYFPHAWFTCAQILGPARHRWTGAQPAAWWIQGQTVAGLLRRFDSPNYEEGRGLLRRERGPGSVWQYKLTEKGLDAMRGVCYAGQVNHRDEPPTERAAHNSPTEGSRMNRPNRLPTTARVFLREGNRCIYLAEPSTEDAMDLASERLPMRGRTTDGERIVIQPYAYTSVVGPADAAFDTMALVGKQVRFRSGLSPEYADLFGDFSADAEGDEQESARVHTVVVEAEDLASAVIVAVDLRDGTYVWVNPACSHAEVKLAAQAAFLAARLTDASVKAMDAEVGHIAAQSQAKVPGMTEDQNNAIASIEAGHDIAHAVAIAGPEFVEAYIAESAFDRDFVVRLNSGLLADLTGYEDPGQSDVPDELSDVASSANGRFIVDERPGGETHHIYLAQIERLVGDSGGAIPREQATESAHLGT